MTTRRTATPRARRTSTTPSLPARTTCAPVFLHCAQPVTLEAVVAAWRTHDVNVTRAVSEDLERCLVDGERVARAYLTGMMKVIVEVLTDRYPLEYSVRRYHATHYARALTAAWMGYRRTLEASPLSAEVA